MNSLNFKNIIEQLLGTFLNAGRIAKEIGAKGVKITYKGGALADPKNATGLRYSFELVLGCNED